MKYLCIGGPADGLTIDVPTGNVRYAYVDTLNREPFYMESGDVPSASQYKKVIYSRDSIKSREGSYFYFFRPEGITSTKVLEYLFAGYPKQ